MAMEKELEKDMEKAREKERERERERKRKRAKEGKREREKERKRERERERERERGKQLQRSIIICPFKPAIFAGIAHYQTPRYVLPFRSWVTVPHGRSTTNWQRRMLRMECLNDYCSISPQIMVSLIMQLTIHHGFRDR